MVGSCRKCLQVSHPPPVTSRYTIAGNAPRFAVEDRELGTLPSVDVCGSKSGRRKTRVPERTDDPGRWRMTSTSRRSRASRERSSTAAERAGIPRTLWETEPKKVMAGRKLTELCAIGAPGLLRLSAARRPRSSPQGLVSGLDGMNAGQLAPGGEALRAVDRPDHALARQGGRSAGRPAAGARRGLLGLGRRPLDLLDRGVDRAHSPGEVARRCGLDRLAAAAERLTVASNPKSTDPV